MAARWIGVAALSILFSAACGNSSSTSTGDDPGGKGDDPGGADAAPYVPTPTVTLTGRVMAPSGDYPISGALVYLDVNAPDAIPSGVYDYSCDSMVGRPHTLSNADGTWSIEVRVGEWNIVTRKGNFRRVRPLTVTEDMETAIPEEITTLPGAKSDDGLDTIPTFAVVRTNPDLTYNLLAKFGMAQLDGSGELIEGTEQFDIYDDSNSGSYPHTSTLFDDQSTLNSYQMIYLPCYSSNVGVNFANEKAEMLRSYVAAGGRIYNSCTVSLWTEAAFPDYIDYYQGDETDKWDIGRRTGSGYETTGNVLDDEMGAWLSIVTSEDPATVPFQNGYVTIDATVDVDDGHGLEEDNGVVRPKTWVADSSAYEGSPLMVTYNYDAGKVFYSVYETSQGGTTMTPQEYVLLYVILEVGVCDNLNDVVQ